MKNQWKFEVMKKHAKRMKKGCQREPKWRQNPSENPKRDPRKPKRMGQSAEKKEAEKGMKRRETIGASEGAELSGPNRGSDHPDGISYVSVFECY